MNLADRKLRLLENIARLRVAQRQLPDSEEIVAVRAALEEELGETVSQRMAARFLGVSHTALARWVKAGDLALVYTPQGRREVPVAQVLDLREEVDRERACRPRRRHVLEPVLSQGRSRARNLRPRELVGGKERPLDGHRRADRRSLAYHRALARRLRRPMVVEALHRVRKWSTQGKLDRRYADQWEEILHKPLPEIKRIICDDTPYARELRQNSPLAGFLSEPERRKMFESIR